MRPLFRWTALLVALATLGLWWEGGLDLGWTRTRVLREKTHPATGARTQSWEPAFVPGIDFLAGGALAATLLVGGSFFCRRPGSEPPPPPQ
jgi:hypothetical protein